MISKRKEPGSFIYIYIYIAFTPLCSVSKIYKHIQKKNYPQEQDGTI